LRLVAFFYSTIILYALMEIIIPHVNRVLKKEATVLADGLCRPTKAVSKNSMVCEHDERKHPPQRFEQVPVSTFRAKKLFNGKGRPMLD